MKRERVEKFVYNVLPQIYRDKVEEEAEYARVENIEATCFNILSSASLLLAFFLLLAPFEALTKVIIASVTVPIIISLPYILVSLYANNRKNEVEKTLPVALNLISSNMKSGLTVDKAFLLSARDEFGPLADDLKHTAMEMFGGKPVGESLTELAESTNSELFRQTLTLLKDGIETGGKVSQLLESSAKDVQKSLRLREEIATNVKMYSMFILIASIIGAPILFSISVHLTEETSEMWSEGDIDFDDLPATRGGFTPEEPSFRPEFFSNFAIAAIAISNISAAFLISVIKKGNMKEGVKYAPVYAITAVAVYLISNQIIQMLL